MSGLSGIFGWFEDKWIRQPLLLGPSEMLTETIIELNAAAGSNVILGSTVPGGEIWVILSTSHLSGNNSNTNVTTGFKYGGNTFPATYVLAPTVNIWYGYSVYLVLFPGYQPHARFTGCVLNDNIYFRYTGFKLLTGET